MKERIHEQISQELKQATRLDMKIVITDIVVTLILFFMAMAFAESTVGSITSSLTGGLTGFKTAASLSAMPIVVMFVIIFVIAVINFFAVRTILHNRAQRARLNEGLMKLYKDEGVDQYYDGSIFKSYETRYRLFAVILGSLGIMSVIVPLVIFIDQLTKL
jgi:hypothetical protein